MEARSAGAAELPPLPPITLAKLMEITQLVERLVSEKTSVFVEAAAEYRARHRKATRRELKPEEAAQVAVGMADALGQEIHDDPGAAAARVQASSLRAYDEPEGREVLLAAGLATAPAFLDVASQIVAMVEMPTDLFETAREGNTLPAAIARMAQDLESLDVAAVRERASRALEHFSQAAGVDTGKAWGLIAQTVWQAMSQMLAMQISSSPSPTSSLVDSAGPDGTSSTEPPGSSSPGTSG